MSIDFKPTCDIQALKARAKLYRQIRQFFIERDVLEVETPILSQAGVTDVHLASVQAQRHVHGKKTNALFTNFTRVCHEAFIGEW